MEHDNVGRLQNVLTVNNYFIAGYFPVPVSPPLVRKVGTRSTFKSLHVFSP